MPENDDLDLGEEKKSSKKLIVIIAALVLLLGGGGAAMYFLELPPFDKQEVEEDDEEAVAEDEEEKEETSSPKEAHFYEFEPFIVNFPRGGEARLLQVAFSVLAYDEDTIEAVEKHAPMIRNNLLLLLGRYKPEDLKSAQGKEALREAFIREIQKVLDLHTEGGSVEAVFFTQFVMQ